MSYSQQNKPKILIGFLNKNSRGPIPTVTKAFIEGLSEKYNFYPFFMERRFGNTRLSKMNMFNLLYFIAHLSRWIYSIIIIRPDIVHFPVTSNLNFEKSMSFLMVGKIFGCKTIGHLHGGGFIDFIKTLSKTRRNFANYFLSKLDSLIVLSNSWKHKVIQLFPFIEMKVYVVPNPIDEEFENFFKEFHRNNENINILSVGIMGREKGVLDILEVAKINNNEKVKFILIGPEREPEINKTCKKFIDKNNLHNKVIITGAKWGNEKINFYKDSSIFLLPSYIENFPVVILEAAASRMAIIATPIGALPDYFIDNYSIKYVQPGNIQSIADAVQQVVADKKFRAFISNNANVVFRTELSRTNIFSSLNLVYANVQAPKT
ncbi:MAG: glycosyltransferase family 4 protein [Melioribacteraceae bacterium]